MSNRVTASLTVNISDPSLDMPFELVEDPEGGAPVQVAYVNETFVISQWADADLGSSGFSPLAVWQPGVKRIRLYCPTAEQDINVTVDSGPITEQFIQVENAVYGTYVTDKSVTFNTVTFLGRRYEEIVEVVTWQKEVRKRLKHYYDVRDMVVLERTVFQTRFGNVLAEPIFDATRGEFYTLDESYGSLVVKYQAGYNLYEITYGNGRQMLSDEAWDTMKKAWLSGDVKSAQVPLVRILARSLRVATLMNFQRTIWPEGPPIVGWTWPSNSGGQEIVMGVAFFMANYYNDFLMGVYSGGVDGSQRIPAIAYLPGSTIIMDSPWSDLNRVYTAGRFSSDYWYAAEPGYGGFVFRFYATDVIIPNGSWKATIRIIPPPDYIPT